ncbi:MAG: hypothetical protein ACTSU4_14665 [Promethearchaeota archaeon]
MTFCGNIVELIEKKKVYRDSDFVLWENTNINENFDNARGIEVYIEKNLVKELMNQKPMIIIDAAIGKTKQGDQIGMLFIKKNKNVYG